jgi:hypothetical protein
VTRIRHRGHAKLVVRGRVDRELVAAQIVTTEQPTLMRAADWRPNALPESAQRRYARDYEDSENAAVGCVQGRLKRLRVCQERSGLGHV